MSRLTPKISKLVRSLLQALLRMDEPRTKMIDPELLAWVLKREVNK